MLMRLRDSVARAFVWLEFSFWKAKRDGPS